MENIDKGTYTPQEYEGCLVELRRVNRWLGDTRALRRSLLTAIERSGASRFSVLDVGAGSGQLLRVAANWAKYNHREGQFIGLELNERSARAIGSDSKHRILAIRGDTFHLPFADDAVDYGICSLFTHHFRDNEVVLLLKELARVSRRQLFVIDLHRHPIAYLFYTTLGRLMLHNRLLREDGALSILRSFKPGELYALAERAGLADIQVSRSFPYRLVLSATKNRESGVSVDRFEQASQSNEQIRLAS